MFSEVDLEFVLYYLAVGIFFYLGYISSSMEDCTPAHFWITKNISVFWRFLLHFFSACILILIAPVVVIIFMLGLLLWMLEGTRPNKSDNFWDTY